MATKKLKKPLKVKARKVKPDASLTPSQEKYRFKPGYAAKQRTISNRKYRKTAGEFELTGNTILKSLDYLEEYAEPIPVLNDNTGEVEMHLCVRPTVLAKLLDTTHPTVWRWMTVTEQLPNTVLTCKAGRESGVYHVQEARVIIRVIGEHMNGFKYYRKDHAATRNKLFDQIEEIRQLNYGVIEDGNEKTGKGPRSKGKRRNNRVRG